jgi:molecular chaperone DnaK
MMQRTDRAIGIDLGTTNSEVAWLPPSEHEIVIYADKFGRKTVASAVSWDAKNQVFLVGHSARARRGSPHPPVESIKRKMGQAVRTRVGERELLPEEISAEVLRELRARITDTLAQGAYAVTQSEVRRAVITVPAYFDAPQVEATRRAGELAGLEVIGILQEPTAAAIYHAWRDPRVAADGNILVYDLGGGTFDVSVLRCLGGEYQVLALDGDNYLGGDDFDRRYAEHLRRLLSARGYALELAPQEHPPDRIIFQRLVHLAQEIKESLSTAEVVSVAKQDFCADQNGESVSFEGEIGRGEYEATIEDLVRQTLDACMRALEQSQSAGGVGLADIDWVVLVGGSTRVPLVERRVREELVAKSRGKALVHSEVDTCVALGAAIHAASIGGTLLRDEARGTTLRITTPLRCASPHVRLGVALEALPPDATEIVLWNGGGDASALASAPVRGGASEPRHVRLTFAVEEETAHLLLSVQSKLGAPLSEFPLTIWRGDARPRPSALTRASVVSKDIGLEVLRAGKRDRRVLIAKGTGLPTQITRLFFTVDQSGTIVLRLLQNLLPIKTIVVEVPRELPIGTPVEVTVSCDESMRIEARAQVAGQSVHVVVDAPDTAALDPEGNFESVLRASELASRELWGVVGDEFRRESERLTSSLREALRIDPDRALALSHRLAALIRDHQGEEGAALTPPYAYFEASLDRLRRIVYRLEGELVGLSREQWLTRVADLERRARKAFDEADGATWRLVNNEAQALVETASIEDWSKVDPNDPSVIARRKLRGEAWLAELRARTTEMRTSADDGLRAARDAELSRISQWLMSAAETPLHALDVEGETSGMSKASRLNAIFDELERIELALDRVPSLGLLTDRGDGSPRGGT